ncbi:MAG: transcription elongation factor GreB [Pseudomonadota bacterium]
MRWRPPPPKQSPYITREGYERLQGELKERWTFRKEVVTALAAAAAEGDRSENAEYAFRKKQLGEIDRRIRYLQKRLPILKVVDPAPSQQRDKVYFGALVTLEYEDGTVAEHRLVGPDEIDTVKRHISIDAPLAKALLGKGVGDEVVLTLPEGERVYEVVSVCYPDTAA